jgi:ArsR family transcriptional regulator
MDAPQPLDPGELERVAAVIKCLGHPLRLRLLDAMEDGERSVTDLTHLAGASQAVVSQQLGVLRGHAVVNATRRGVHVYYGIAEPKIRDILTCIRSGDGLGHPGTPATAS